MEKHSPAVSRRLATCFSPTDPEKKHRKLFRYFEDQGVHVKVISGDTPVTVSEVARQAGIAHAEDYIDASTLKTPEELEEAILKYTVFGRVTPDQKRQF